MNRIAEDTHARSQDATCAQCAGHSATAPDQAVPGTVGPENGSGPTRRFVATTALGALAAGALAACGGGDDDPIPTTQPSAATSAGGASATEGSGGGFAKVADIPVGGAISGQTPDGTKVILSQPQAGTVVAFDARCPHQGCTVAPSGDKLLCPCHGSTFQTADGAVITGPATSGLTEVTVSVDGDDVVAG